MPANTFPTNRLPSLGTAVMGRTGESLTGCFFLGVLEHLGMLWGVCQTYQ